MKKSKWIRAATSICPGLINCMANGELVASLSNGMPFPDLDNQLRDITNDRLIVIIKFLYDINNSFRKPYNPIKKTIKDFQ